MQIRRTLAKTFVNTCANILNLIYGYEGLNLLFKILPSRYIIYVITYFGGNVGKGTYIQCPLMIHNAGENKSSFSNLTIGDDSYIGRDCMFDLMGKISIGNQVTISHRAVFNTHTNAGKSPLINYVLKVTSGDIEINDGTYLGSNTTVLENVVIGRKVIIGSKSLVNNNIPNKVTAYGIPCKVQKVNE